MDYVYAFFSLFAGLGAFLIGFKILSDNVGKLANSGLKKLFSKTSKNRFIGVGVGTVATAIIQSSSAATVMVVGFVNAGLMDLYQATAMIMGANIGTTITAQIVALESFNFVQFAMALAGIGIFMNMICKKDRNKTIGMVFAGLGLVFLALDYMSDSMSIFRDSKVFMDAISKVNNPFLLLLIGLGFTALIQSSSAVTTIIISMVGAGITIGTNCNSVLFIILGCNIGTCVTAMLSSIGATTNARRASLIHLMFNVFATTIFFVVLLIWKNFMNDTLIKWFEFPTTQIAMFHTFFNVIATLMFIPFIKMFVSLANLIIRDKKEEKVTSHIDERFLKTPSVAITQVTKEAIRLGQLAMDTLDLSIDGFLNKNLSVSSNVASNIKYIEILNEDIISYLIKISSQDISEEEETIISSLHHSLNDFYREAEIADNMVKYTRHLVNDNLEFSDNVYEGIKDLKNKLDMQFDFLKQIVLDKKYELLSSVDEIEDQIDALRSNLIKSHIKRLEEGTCSPVSNGVFINLVSNLERAGDHLNYVAHAMVSEG